jgi:hypothetical protein
MRKRTMIAAVLAVMVGLAGLPGCAIRGPDAAGADGAGVPLRDEEPRLREQAADALRRWDEAVTAAGGLSGFVPISEATTIVGTLEPDLAGNAKEALTYGAIELSGLSGSLRMPGGQVVWTDGTTKPVRTMTVDEAVSAMRRNSSPSAPTCGCTPLRIVAATPVTIEVETTRGPATAPAWEFALAGTAAKLRQLAVARAEGIEVTPPPWDATNPPAGLSIERATVSADGRQLTVQFTGSNGTASQTCGYDYTAEAVESDTAVVVIVRAYANWTLGPNQACNLIGYPREATTSLAAPLEDRAVLEVRTGMPVPVRRA